ncbi:MAG: hypothetical protein OCD03_05840 [Hyphomicrobiales bacterium]
MAYITSHESDLASPVSTKVSLFLKKIGNAFIKAQEARARQHVKTYMSKSYRPF